MRTFLWTLAVSTMVSIGLWNFGFARRISPAHPFLATLIGALLCGLLAQGILSHEARHSTRR